ncbi:hypothetical protein S40293_05508 [Stachybotrys chartarum IBT 40293]|nr:hypothetical protein S40293_05508 [Stachybotrys chartarum IBT 40293]
MQLSLPVLLLAPATQAWPHASKDGIEIRHSLRAVDDLEPPETPPIPPQDRWSLPVVDGAIETLPVVSLNVVHVERRVLDKRSVEMELENRSDVAYYARFSIGNPGQDVYAQLDTGSWELWVSPDCARLETGADREFCTAAGHYEPNDSSSAEMTGETSSLHYGIGSSEIEYVRDDIALSDTVKVRSLQFGVATSSNDQFAGVLGLGYGNPRNLGYNNLVDELAEQGVTRIRAFSIALGSKAEGQGVIHFGGVDTSKFNGRLAQLPIIPAAEAPDGTARYWVQMKSLTNSPPSGSPTTYQGTEMPVFLDTGATLTLLPPAVVASIGAQFESVARTSQGFYIVDCEYADVEGTFDFAFDGVTVRVPYREMVRQYRSNPPSCYLGFSPSERFTLLGDTFLRSAYVVFDQEADVAYLAQYRNCGSTVTTINESSDLEGLTGRCGSSEDNGSAAADEDYIGEDGGSADEDDEDAQPSPAASTTATSTLATATAPSVTGLPDTDPGIEDGTEDLPETPTPTPDLPSAGSTVAPSSVSLMAVVLGAMVAGLL